MNQQTNGTAQPSPEPLDAFPGWSLDKKVIVAALILVIIAFGGCTARALQEIAALKPRRIVLAEKAGVTRQAATPKPKIHPLGLMPTAIDGYRTVASQQMPGAATYAAEGIYEPNDEEIMIKTPLNVYVAITYHISAASARKSIEKQLLMSYPKDQVEVPLRGRAATSGLDSEKGSYMLAWTEGGYSIEVNGSFTQYVPAHQEDTIKKTTLAVAEGVADQVQTVLGKAK